VIAALIFCWAVLGIPAGKRLAPILPELVAVLRRHDELDIDEDTAALLVGMSAATIDRRLAGERRQLSSRAAHAKPGTLLKSQIPVRTWADWDDAVPGFVEIDLVSHDGGNAAGEHAWTLTAQTSPPPGPRAVACPTRPQMGAGRARRHRQEHAVSHLRRGQRQRQ
jgi:hypothetical protein